MSINNTRSRSSSISDLSTDHHSEDLIEPQQILQDKVCDEENQIHRKETQGSTMSKKLAAAHEKTLKPNEIRIVLCAMAMCSMLSFIDSNCLATVLPYIAEDLNAELTISWANTSQLIAMTCFQLVCGRFADIFGRKHMILGCIIGLAVFDLACGLAQTDIQFFMFRAFCGLFDGCIASLGMVVMSDIVPLKERGKYQGYLVSFVGVGLGAGPFLVSAFVQHSTWRNFYFMLFGLVLSSTVFIWYYVPSTKSPMSVTQKIKSIDYFGFILGCSGLVLLLVPTNGGGLQFAWNSPKVIAMFVVGGVLMVSFVFVEIKVAKLPVVPMRLFRSPVVTLVLIQSMLFGMAFFPLYFYYTYYFEIVRGLTPLITSCFYLAVVVPQISSSAISGYIVSYTNRYNPMIWLGFTLWTLALGLVAGIFDMNTSFVAIVFIMIINGTGQGMSFQNTMIAGLAHARKEDRSVFISTRQVFRYLGGSIGLAISALIFSTSFIYKLNNDSFINKTENFELNEVLRHHVYSKVDLNTLNATADQIEYVKHLYLRCCKNVFILWAPLIGTCLLMSFLIKDKGLDFKRDDSPHNEKKEDITTVSTQGSKSKTHKYDEMTKTLHHSTSSEDLDQISKH
ncbi:CYFA0S03e04676g1_1 [Cyberlindnera fabianii]|uniref:CYFA0S03e04676g1_1 n=2 Tax=Cyberlindnera fabianii TaxID=36022 RepID=A0A061AQY8_CYBFA|nr:CYFA0S03e04676g1_1 [Cyberlindnera fabianii]